MIKPFNLKTLAAAAPAYFAVISSAASQERKSSSAGVEIDKILINGHYIFKEPIFK